jgi:hypothetical protein
MRDRPLEAGLRAFIDEAFRSHSDATVYDSSSLTVHLALCATMQEITVMPTPRDDFSKETKDILAKRVGLQCSNPNCRRPTSGPQTHPRKAVNIGVAAHICAAAPGGPRYDTRMTEEDRCAIEKCALALPKLREAR